jgi:hypothetical protein
MDDSKLQALFAADAVPARDSAFTLAVLKRMEAQRLRQQFISLLFYAVLGGVILFALSPLLAGGINLYVVAAMVLASLWVVRRDLPGAELLSL